jgi:pSer/pThr/pTyr-binding forkhead associated (FHA) protein
MRGAADRAQAQHLSRIIIHRNCGAAMFELIFQSGKLKGKRLTLPLEKAIVVGREAGSQLMLGSSSISRKHCELKHVADGIWVRDLNSQNGTYVNEVAIATPTLLRAGDALRVGTVAFEVQVAHAKPAKPVDKEKVGGLSDSEIASWLTDHEGATSSTDTVTIPTYPSTSSVSASNPAPATPRKFKSVKEEAADIIRRHWEKVEQREGSSGRS